LRAERQSEGWKRLSEEAIRLREQEIGPYERSNEPTTPIIAARCEQPPIDAADIADKTGFIDHSEWERRLADGKARLNARAQKAPAEEHSTGFLDRCKKWATGLLNKARDKVSKWIWG
jgi:hypothetical protein